MTSQEEIQSEALQPEEQTIDDLKQKIHLSNNKLLELTYTQQKYMNTIINFNKQAKNYIQEQYHEEALVYLTEAERILQYGASCGKSIDRNLIISILHNEACCYYRQNDLQKAASYLEAIIYNIKIHNNSMMPSLTNSSVVLLNKSKSDEFYLISVQKKIQLVHYYLRYCTVNSQAKKREAALSAGKNVIKLTKSLFHDLINQNPKINFESQSQEQITQFINLINKQRFFVQEIQPDMYQQILKLVIFSIQMWKKKIKQQTISTNFQKYITNYSISEVIQILPIEYIKDTDIQYNQLVNAKVILRQLLHTSMGYFTISTEYRLLADHRFQKQAEQKLKSDQYKFANIYHLLSILFLTTNLNCDLLFISQIINSYQHHYKTKICVENNSQIKQNESFVQKNYFNSQKQFFQAAERVIYQKKKSKFSKHNDLLFQKMTKLKQKQRAQMKNSINDQYGTLNSTKIKYNKKQQKNIKKRSISKDNLCKSSSKKILFKKVCQNQKNSINSSHLNQSKERSISISNNRKRSISKDSEGSKQIHLNIQRFNTIQRTNNQYQINTKKIILPGRKRRVSSISSNNQGSIRNKQVKSNSKQIKSIIPINKNNINSKYKNNQKINKNPKDPETRQCKIQKQKKDKLIKQHKPVKQHKESKIAKNLKISVTIKKKKDKQQKQNYYL